MWLRSCRARLRSRRRARCAARAGPRARQVHDHPGARPGRDGRGLGGPRSRARSRGRAQAVAPRADGPRRRHLGPAPPRGAGDWSHYQQLKAEAIKANKGPLTGEIAKLLATCETDYAAAVKEHKAQEVEREASFDKQIKENAERAKKAARAEKALRASLKQDRGRIYDKYGKPTTWDGDLDKTPEWSWVLEKTHLGYEASCWTFVRFKGNKKVKEWQDGEACKWR